MYWIRSRGSSPRFRINPNAALSKEPPPPPPPPKPIIMIIIILVHLFEAEFQLKLNSGHTREPELVLCLCDSWVPRTKGTDTQLAFITNGRSLLLLLATRLESPIYSASGSANEQGGGTQSEAIPWPNIGQRIFRSSHLVATLLLVHRRQAKMLIMKC